VMKVKELLDVLIWQRDKSQGKLNSPPCRLRMTIVKADDKNILIWLWQPIQTLTVCRRRYWTALLLFE
jgi:hypothetical protein